MADADILLVDDDTDVIRVMSQALKVEGTLRFATGGAEALALLAASVPDLILLDAEMPGMNGFQLCRTLKADPLLADVPVIFVTSHSDDALQVAGLEMGAVDFISKPVNPVLLQARVRTHLRLKRMSDVLREMSSTDPLTGIANRRRFDDSLGREWRRAWRTARPLSLLMIDIDHFKAFNDFYGHPAGDACLRAVAVAMQHVAARPGDLLARYGGEEFALLLPDTPADGAASVAQSVLLAVERLAIRHEAVPGRTVVSVSVGVGSFDSASASWRDEPGDTRTGCNEPACDGRDLLLAADQALYDAKASGRGRAVSLDVDHARSGDSAPRATQH